MRVRLPFLAAALAVLAAPAHAQSYRAMWGPGPNDIWAVGGAGLVAHFDGRAWSQRPTGYQADLNAVWGAAPNDVWAVGESGAVFHWNGSAWQVTRLGEHNWVSIGGCAANDVWMVGQSEDEDEAPTLMHWNGSAWSGERLSIPFRAAGIALACPDVWIAGATYFDPRPDQRRNAGVLMRRSGGSWTMTGWNGRAMTDPAVGGASWTSIALGGGSTLLAGVGDNGPVAIASGRTGGWRPLPPLSVPGVERDGYRFILGADGTPVAVFENGFARLVNGQWAVTAAGDAGNGGMSRSTEAEMERLGRQLQADIAAGRQPSQDLIRRMSELSQGMQQATGRIVAAAGRAQRLAFGSRAAAWPAGGGDFYVAGAKIFRVRGNESAVVYEELCRACYSGRQLPPATAAPSAPAAAPAAAPGQQRQPVRTPIPAPSRRTKLRP